MNTVTASFNAAERQTSEMSKWLKTLSKKWLKCLSEKKIQALRYIIFKEISMWKYNNHRYISYYCAHYSQNALDRQNIAQWVLESCLEWASLPADFQTVMCNVIWNQFLIKNLLIDSLLVSCGEYLLGNLVNYGSMLCCHNTKLSWEEWLYN